METVEIVISDGFVYAKFLLLQDVNSSSLMVFSSCQGQKLATDVYHLSGMVCPRDVAPFGDDCPARMSILVATFATGLCNLITLGRSKKASGMF